MSDPLEVTKANMRRLRAIYATLTVVGGVASGAVGALLAGPMDFDGPIIAVAVVAFGVFGIGAVMLALRGRVERAPIVVTLTERPERVRRIYPKLTQSSAYGANLSEYKWVVVETDDGRTYDLYAGGDDLSEVLREVCACAPDAEVDERFRVEHLAVR